MVFELGNTLGARLEDIEVFKDAYKAYCAHLAGGKSQKSFVYKNDKMRYGACGYEAVENTVKSGIHGDAANPIQKEIAKKEGYAKWEQHVADSATYKDKGKSNTASLQMIMRNKYKWDTKEHLHIMDTENDLTPTDKAIDGTTKSLLDRPEPL